MGLQSPVLVFVWVMQRVPPYVLSASLQFMISVQKISLYAIPYLIVPTLCYSAHPFKANSNIPDCSNTDTPRSKSQDGHPNDLM